MVEQHSYAVHTINSTKTKNIYLVDEEKKWYCKNCLDSILPFSSISQNIFFNLYQTKLETEILKIKNSGKFLETCTVCTKTILNRHKFVPCSFCKSLIHEKCSDKANLLLSFREVHTWICSSCTRNTFPFMELNDFEFNKLQYNNNNYNTSDVIKTTTEKLTKTFDFCELMENENEINTINCDYYDQAEFKTLIDHHVSNDNFSILHTNISSIQGNFDKLELLLAQIDDSHCFDIISLSELGIPLQKDIYLNLRTYQVIKNTLGNVELQ